MVCRAETAISKGQGARRGLAMQHRAF